MELDNAVVIAKRQYSRVGGFNTKNEKKLQPKQMAPVTKKGKEKPPASNKTPPTEGPTIIPTPKQTSVKA